MNRSESINELAGALAKAQGQMTSALMDTKNQFGGVYADLGSIMEAAKQPLAVNGLSVSQHPELSDTGRVTITTILAHSSGQWMESSISAPIGDNRALSAAQQAGIVITYLRRYAYAAIVGIYADKDTDGAEPTGNGNKPTSQPVRAAQNPTVHNKPTPAPLPAAAVDASSEVPALTLAEIRRHNWRPDAKMTYDTACTFKSGSTGQRYMDMECKDLSGSIIGLKSIIAKPETTDTNREEATAKRDAAQAIINATPIN